MQNRSETEGQLLFTATGETANTEPTNSTESDNIGFPLQHLNKKVFMFIVWLVLLM